MQGGSASWRSNLLIHSGVALSHKDNAVEYTLLKVDESKKKADGQLLARVGENLLCRSIRLAVCQAVFVDKEMVVTKVALSDT